MKTVVDIRLYLHKDEVTELEILDALRAFTEVAGERLEERASQGLDK